MSGVLWLLRGQGLSFRVLLRTPAAEGKIRIENCP